MNVNIETKQTDVRINSSTLFAMLRVLEEAVPLVEEAVVDVLEDDEERQYWEMDLEAVRRVLRTLDLSYVPTSWLMVPYRTVVGVAPEYDIHV